MAGVDFFARGGLPVPRVTILQAERVAALLGLTVRAQPLGSQQDSNFLLADGGSVLGVLKIANPAFSPAGLTVTGEGNRVHVSLPVAGAPAVPPLVRPEYAKGWLALVADPAPLLGLPAAARSGEGDLLKRRAASSSSRLAGMEPCTGAK